MHDTPQTFVASGRTCEDLIGPAQQVGRILRTKAADLATRADARLKLLLYGPPGVGKSTLAYLTARGLAHELAIEFVPGRDCTIDLVRDWMAKACYGTLFGNWTVKWIDELDLVTPAAQDMLLSYLDRLPAQTAFIATSNLQLDLLQERFQSRLQAFKVAAPESEAIADLVSTHGLPKPVAQMIGVGSGGNVRAALLDAQSDLDTRAAA